MERGTHDRLLADPRTDQLDGTLRSKVDRFVPDTQYVNLTMVGQPE